MIDRLRESARARVDGADALWRREEQTAVTFESGRLKSAGISEEAGLNLRVLAGGRMGVAGTPAPKPRPGAVVARGLPSPGLREGAERGFSNPSPPPPTPNPHVLAPPPQPPPPRLLPLGR